MRTRPNGCCKEGKLPDNVDPSNSKLEDPEERAAWRMCSSAA